MESYFSDSIVSATYRANQIHKNNKVLTSISICTCSEYSLEQWPTVVETAHENNDDRNHSIIPALTNIIFIIFIMPNRFLEFLVQVVSEVPVS